MFEPLKTGSPQQRAVVPGNPSFSVGAEASNTIVTTIQLKDSQGRNVRVKAPATVWLSDTALGVPSAVAPTGGVSFTTGVALKEDTSKVLWRAVSDANGVLVFSVAEGGAKSYHVCVDVGGLLSSQIITFV